MSSAFSFRHWSGMGADGAAIAERDRGGFWALYAAAWVPILLAYALQIVRSGAPWWGALLGSAYTIVPVAILGVFVLRVTIRRLGSLERGKAFVVHAMLAGLFSAAWTGIVVSSIYFGAPPGILDRFLREAIGWQYLSGLTLYAVLAAVGSAVRASRRLREQEAAAARSESLRMQAELQALRARLDPHFLFNTLHTLMALVRSDRQRAEQALERFGDLLRYVLDVNRDDLDEVALADEWAFVRDYLALEQLRLGDRLTVRESLDPDTLDVAIPSFTLQPLVENAIRHGIAPLAEGGILGISSALDGDTLVLEVRDDGAGAPAEGSKREGVGIRVVRQRLMARYGEAARLEIRSAPGMGFVAMVHLPASTTSPRRASAPAGGDFQLPAAAAESVRHGAG
jgi:sensor histidine kinase YesM